MAHWTLDDIDWTQFDAGKVTPELASLAKAACLVEHNGHDYARYLCEVFEGDTEFQALAMTWAREEVQHGEALRKWAELADPAFNFDKSFTLFTENYKLPMQVDMSVRGSRTGELLARCVVEVGTSSYYTAIKDYTDEPVLKAICAKIAADEFRHYKLFYTMLKQYLKKEHIGMWTRIKVAVGRIVESEDDELAYAFFASHVQYQQQPYVRKTFTRLYWACASGLYRKPHIDVMVPMVFKAVGLTPHSRLNRVMNHVAWYAMRLKQASARAYLPPHVTKLATALAGLFFVFQYFDTAISLLSTCGYL